MWIKNQIPVVLLQNVKGVGQKGQIVHVKRGYARHTLVAKGLAAFGTWENIDMYADPKLIDDPVIKARAFSDKGRLPFDWVDEVELRFIRQARQDQLSILLEPVTVWDILEELSANHDLDLLPSNLEMPESLVAMGKHEVPVRIAFRNPETTAGRYTIRVELVSLQTQQEEVRKQEMQKQLEEHGRFQLKAKDPAGEVLDPSQVERRFGGAEEEG